MEKRQRQEVMNEITAATDIRMRKYAELDRILAPSLGLVGDRLAEEVDLIRACFEETGEVSARVPPELKHRALRIMLEAKALWRVHLELMAEYRSARSL
jgi:hypothetical protein